MPAALASGAVDAVAFFPPYSGYVSRQGNASVVFDSRRIPGEISMCWWWIRGCWSSRGPCCPPCCPPCPA
jgi:ABC-type nitrate/sulfonate/bicarbonate transport system substrate-binding protein